MVVKKLLYCIIDIFLGNLLKVSIHAHLYKTKPTSILEFQPSLTTLQRQDFFTLEMFRSFRQDENTLLSLVLLKSIKILPTSICITGILKGVEPKEEPNVKQGFEDNFAHLFITHVVGPHKNHF